MKLLLLHRLTRISIYLTVLALMMIYGHNNYPAVTLKMCLEQPEEYDGALIGIGNEILVEELTLNGFIIRQMGQEIEVVGDNSQVREDDYVSLKAVFHQGPWLELKELHVAKNRRAKIYISIFPTLFILAYVSKNLRISSKGLGWKYA